VKTWESILNWSGIGIKRLTEVEASGRVELL
jgi:hypothetical protein